MRKPWKRIKKLRRSGRRRHPEARHRQADRTLVAGRGEGRTAGHPDPRLGDQRQSPPPAQGPALRMGLYLRRGLPGPRYRRSTGAADRQRRYDVSAPRRNRFPGQARMPRRDRCRWRWMASNRGQGDAARKHLPPPPATILTRTEPGRKRLAVPSPEPSQQHHLQGLRGRSRRILSRLERPHRRARPYQIHCHTGMGNGQNLMRLVFTPPDLEWLRRPRLAARCGASRIWPAMRSG